ncbi:afadin- and alpha-actinin-binding protein A-like isoform X2 [Apostichopus japonicus]|uniref:afadin- and alpha-actinin-binding protein A-like isoform X2 n=1 Tax=Stichopus japonicus TaxID=307972 RepID=UPI003AB27FFA
MATFSTPTSSLITNGVSPHGFSSRYFIPTQMSPEQTAKSSFCNKDNLAQCIAYISEEMTSLGYPSIYSDSAENNNHSEVLIQLTNCCYELMQRHQRNLKNQEEQETRHMKVNSDYSHIQTRHTQTKEKLDQVEKDNVSLAEQCRQLTNQISSLQNKLKSAKEENKKLESLMKGRDTQFRHDLKKKERELSKLKERVHQLMTDKNHERRIGMDILNSIQRTDGKRGTWKTGKSGLKQEEEMYRLIVTNYEERQKELMMENQELRESLSSMQKELVDLLNRQSPEKQDTLVSESCDFSETTSLCSSVDELSTGHFQMPFEMVREGIESSLRQKCQKLKEHIEQIEKENRENKENVAVDSRGEEEDGSAILLQYGGSETKAALEKEIQKLKGKLKSYRDVIEQQENAMQFNETQNGSLSEFIKDSQFLEEKELLAEEKRRLQQQKVKFDRERKNFSDAAVRLGQERKRFEEERSSFLQQQMLSSSPQSSPHLRPARSINTSISPQSKGTPSGMSQCNTPSIVTPSQLISNRTPSTQELYRALKLVPDGGDCLNSSRDSLNSVSQRSVRSDVSKTSDRSRASSSTPRSTTPRSTRGGLPSSANSSRRGSLNGDSTERRTTPACRRERLEEHKKNLRKTMAQRNTRKAAAGGSDGRKL